MELAPANGQSFWKRQNGEQGVSRRTFLAGGAAAAAILASLQFTPMSARAADGAAFAAARKVWRESLVGAGYDPTDPTFAARLSTIATTANKWKTQMLTGAARTTTLWSDLPITGRSLVLTNMAKRLRDMAIGWSSVGASSYQNESLRLAILDGLSWFTSTVYTPSTAPYDNWYEWNIAVPQALNDTAVLVFDQLTPAQLQTLVAAEAYQVPQLPTTGTQAAAANLALIADGFSGRGVLSDDIASVNAALTSLGSIFTYANPVGGTVAFVNGGNLGAIAAGTEAEVQFFSHDGFYRDGSFVQHGQFPYVGGYGASFLTSLIASILRTTPLGASLDSSIVNTWIHEAFEPWIWNGAMMDTVRGRNIAFAVTSDHPSGHAILACCLPLLAAASGAAKERLAGFVKQELLADTAHDATSAFSLAQLSMARALLADQTVALRGPLVKTQVFGAMDRVLHRKESFAAAVAMNSWRISNYETGNNENLAAWYTADGAMYLYNDDATQFDDGYWYTIDPYRMPGTTVDTVTRSRAPQPWKTEYHNPDFWAGGVSAGNWGAAGLRLTAQSPSTLTCRKSWFFFDDAVLCVGDGITVAAGRTAETIVENRRSTSVAAATITVDGAMLGSTLGAVDTVPTASWAHVAGAAGYVFPTPVRLSAKRESRSGTLKDIATARTSPVATNTFSTLVLDHTAAGTDAYSYVVLPNATTEATAAFAAQPTVRVVAQASSVHAARQRPTGRFAATFFEAGSASFVTAAQPSAVAVEELADELIVSISDPTQTSSTVTIDLDIESADVIAADAGVSVVRVGATTRVIADVSATPGASSTVRIRYVLTADNVAERIKTMNKDGLLEKKPYLELADRLKDLQKAIRKGTELGTPFLETLESLRAEISEVTYAQIEDLGSRLVARIG
ncbi:MAG TPA: polysaccharide lyase 8 family protein [Candidatus Lumbricidophila sp.]|nr:polysaccharide lyase 8 family protein [Candidatus Lumbricidophila sp.]